MKRMSTWVGATSGDKVVPLVFLAIAIMCLAGCNGAEVRTSSMPPPQSLLSDAAASAKLPIVAPTYFPTGAKHLWRVTTPSAYEVRLDYNSDSGDGLTLDIRPNGAQPDGERLDGEFAGYTVYREGTGTSQGAKTGSYTAIGTTRTIDMEFAGDQPTLDELGKMLGSLKPVGH